MMRRTCINNFANTPLRELFTFLRDLQGAYILFKQPLQTLVLVSCNISKWHHQEVWYGSLMLPIFSGNSLRMQNGQPFSTKDRDNDRRSYSCAGRYSGAWWYNSPCHQSNLNGLYFGGKTEKYASGVVWFAWRGFHYSLKSTEMKIKAK